MAKTSLTRARRSLETRIVMLRGEKVLLDEDLSRAYGVETKQLNQAVKRNLARFPADFVFQLSSKEWIGLKSQIVTSNDGRGGRRKLPWVFTEHGATMAAMVLQSSRAVEMSVFVVRAFASLRQLADTHTELAVRLAELEKRVTTHDAELRDVIAALRSLLQRGRGSPKSREPAGDEDEKPRRRIGYSPQARSG